MSAEKERLRRELLARRAALRNRREKDRAILRAVTEFPLYRKAPRLLCYVSVSEETDTRLLLELALTEGKEVFVPRCLPEYTLEFCRIGSLEELSPGRFGILEPPEGGPALKPGQEENALCIVPGVAFDPTGCRLGHGKGCYDRFLAGKKIVCMGLCYRELVLPKLPAEEHDRKVDLLATEEGVTLCFPSGPERKPL